MLAIIRVQMRACQLGVLCHRVFPSGLDVCGGYSKGLDYVFRSYVRITLLLCLFFSVLVISYFFGMLLHVFFREYLTGKIRFL